MSVVRVDVSFEFEDQQGDDVAIEEGVMDMVLTRIPDAKNVHVEVAS